MRIRYIKYYKDNMTSLFTALANDSRVATLLGLKIVLNTTDADTLDILYLSHSGEKYISPFLKMLLLTDVAPDTTARMKAIVDAIVIKYGDFWNKTILALTKDYNPIENYDLKEHEEINSNIHNESKLNKFGFNTDDDTPVGDTVTSSDTTGSKDNNYKDLHKYGNVGVTSSQDLIRQEIELRKNFILDFIFNDIDKLLCLKVY